LATLPSLQDVGKVLCAHKCLEKKGFCAQERLEVLRPMTFLETTSAALALAKELIQAEALPEAAAGDALHIAVAATQGVSYLLTWNCRHLANATMRPLIESVCVRNGIKAPIICTPEELLEAKP
jgi:hypothetical protein